MTALIPDHPCPACGATHTLHVRDPDRHPRTAVYRYTCPVAEVAVSARLTGRPEFVILAPAGAVPLPWVSD
jgi:hypothetical protein